MILASQDDTVSIKVPEAEGMKKEQTWKLKKEKVDVELKTVWIISRDPRRDS